MPEDSKRPERSLRLGVGVAGHISIGNAGPVDLTAGSADAPVDEVEAAVNREIEAAFDSLTKDFSLPIIVFSSLAEGADRLVAGIAKKRGYSLVVPLPCDPDAFKATFSPKKPDRVREASIRQFDELYDTS